MTIQTHAVDSDLSVISQGLWLSFAMTLKLKDSVFKANWDTKFEKFPWAQLWWALENLGTKTLSKKILL